MASSRQQPEHQQEEQQQQPQPQISDEALFSRASYLPYEQSNYCINYSNFKAHHQELWNSLEHIPTANPEMCEGYIDNIKVQITQEFLRNVLRLPQKEDRKEMADFEIVPKKGVIIRDLRELGFDESVKKFTSSSRFLKKNLAALRSTLFMPINRLMIWTQFVSVVQRKSGYPYVPFLRFLKLIIVEFMRKIPSITTRSHDGCPKDEKMKRLVGTCGNTDVEAMRIPEALLSYADAESSAVVDYKLANPTVPAAPLGPTPQGRIASKVGVGSEGAGQLEHEESGDDNIIPEVGGVNITRVVEERVVKTRASKKRKHGSTTIGSSRVTTSSVDPSSENTSVLVDSIERDSIRPLEHAHTSPSHLSSSQKDLISHKPREKLHQLSSTPPSMIDHELEDVCLHSSLPPPDSHDNHMDHTDYTEIPFSGVLLGTSIPDTTTTMAPMLSLPSSSDSDNTPATRGFVKSSMQELKDFVADKFRHLSPLHSGNAPIPLNTSASSSSSTLPHDEHQKYSYFDLCTMLLKNIRDQPQYDDSRKSPILGYCVSSRNATSDCAISNFNHESTFFMQNSMLHVLPENIKFESEIIPCSDFRLGTSQPHRLSDQAFDTSQ
ncbi:hypothetical protein Tco_1405066 [Tanacetum coccineum]